MTRSDGLIIGVRRSGSSPEEREARASAAEHARRLADYERLLPRLEGDPGAAFGLASLRLGLRYEQLAVDFWQDVADNPPLPTDVRHVND